jgi:ribonuclease HI
VIVTPEPTIKNRMRSQTTIFSAKQEAIIKAIYISKGKGATVIATDSLSTNMAVEGTRWTKNPKTRRIRQLLDQEKGKVKLMLIPSHSGIMENERPDETAKNALEEDINNRELYSPQDLINWMIKTDAKNRQDRWAQGENTMRFRKETIELKDDSTNLSRKEQVVVSRLKTKYTRGT